MLFVARGAGLFDDFVGLIGSDLGGFFDFVEFGDLFVGVFVAGEVGRVFVC